MSNTRYLINKNAYNPNYELLYISKSKFENDWHSTAHFHPFTEIFFITDGKGAFYLSDQIVNVNKWDLIIINSNCKKKKKSSLSDVPLEYIVMGVDNLLLNFPESYSLTDNDKQIKLYEIMNFAKDKDVILVEGYKKSSLRKIEVYRNGFSDKIISPKESLIAIASDEDLNFENVLIVKKDDYKKLVDLILQEKDYKI